MSNDNFLRLPKLGKQEFSVLILILGLVVMFVAHINVWPWILIVLAATEIPMLYSHHRIHWSRVQVILWLASLPILIYSDNHHPHKHILEFGLIFLASVTLTLYFIRLKVDSFTMHRSSTNGEQSHAVKKKRKRRSSSD
jgi:hypothetical protein